MAMKPVERDTLLVPTDFSDVADCAIDHAVEIAKIFRHRVRLLHVSGKGISGTEHGRMLKAKLQKQTAQLCRQTGLDVGYILREGQFLPVTREVAEIIAAEFIVMGIHGKKGYERFAVSDAYKMVCIAEIPVLVVKHMHQHVGYRNIVVPIDFSSKSAQKISQAIRFAKYFNAHVRVFGFLSDANKARIIKKEALMKSVTDIFTSEQIMVSTDLLVNPGQDWAESLMRFAAEIEADLIMIVAEKGWRIPEIFSANATERILDKVDVPVLTIAPSPHVVEEGLKKRDLLRPFLDPLGVTRWAEEEPKKP